MSGRGLPRQVVPAELADRLRALQALAATSRGGRPLDHPARAAGVELAAAFAALVEQGYNHCALARAAGVQRRAVQARLERHGYRPPAPSTADQKYRGVQVAGGQPRPECLHGHRMAGDNVVVWRSGRRACRECNRISSATQRRKAAAR